MQNSNSSTKPGRIGFRYYPDTLHYRESDLQTWLPQLSALNAGWLVLEAPADRAVPEDFIRGLLHAGIQPVLQMRLPLSEPYDGSALSILFEAYGHWGVEYIAPFDQPNTQQAWGSGGWVQQRLVERFLDRFIPLAEKLCQFRIKPVFPGLQPGGHFWDTVFLRSALQGIKSRGHTRLLESLVLGAYAWPNGHELEWGAGGPQAWPDVRPYDTPEGQQDHLGFRIFEWYTAISEAGAGKALPVILLGTGVEPVDLDSHADTNFKIAQLLTDSNEIPDTVLGGCFPLVCAEAGKPEAKRAWFTPEGKGLPVVARLQEWLQSLKEEDPQTQPETVFPVPGQKPIKHYLLLPHPKWGNPEWFLKVTRPFVKKHAPTTGYSIREAFFAQRVTIVGGVQVFPENLKAELEKSGSQVIQISGSGTEIATILADL